MNTKLMLEIEASPPQKVPPVATGLADGNDWHLRLLLSQILGPVNRLASVFNFRKESFANFHDWRGE